MKRTRILEKRTKLFEGLDQDQVREIFEIYFESKPTIRKRVGVKPDIAQGIFVLTQGEMELFIAVKRVSDELDRVVLGQISEGDFFGKVSYLRAYGIPAIHTADAVITTAPLEAYRIRDVTGKLTIPSPHCAIYLEGSRGSP